MTDEVYDGAKAILAFGPYTTGHLTLGLRRQINYGPYIVTGTVGISGRHYPYAASVEGGAVRHTIRPRSPGGYLHFYWRKIGKTVTLRSVNHPGQVGKAYLRIPLLVVGPKYNMIVYTDL